MPSKSESVARGSFDGGSGVIQIRGLMHWVVFFFLTGIALGIGQPAYAQSTILKSGVYEGNNYEVRRRGTDAISWKDAKSECEGLGGHLATIHSEGENGHLYSLLVDVEASTGEKSDTWIGFTDEDVEGAWKWVTTEPVTYTNWAVGQPDNNGSEDFGQMLAPGSSLGHSGSWNDYINYREHREFFFCEYEGSSLIDAGILFDDFDYEFTNSSEEDSLFGTSWWNTGGETQEQKDIWYGYEDGMDNVFVNPGGVDDGSILLWLSQLEKGTGPGGTNTPIVSTLSFYGKGTYAARVKFDDNPTWAVETFWLQSPWDLGYHEDYAECDFEYLPCDFWQSLDLTCWLGSSLYFNTHDTADGNHLDRDPKDVEIQLGGTWTTLIVRVEPGEFVEYSAYDDSGLLVTPSYVVEGEKVDFVPEPDSAMQIAFNVWVKSGKYSDEDVIMNVDWVLHVQDDTSLDWSDVTQLVQNLRDSDVKRRDTTVPYLDPRIVFNDGLETCDVSRWSGATGYVESGECGGTPPNETTVMLPGDVPMTLVYIPAGTFLMGSPEDERGHYYYGDLTVEDLHEVTLTSGYYIGKTEVTQAQWEAVMGSNPSAWGVGDEFPVHLVSWNDIAGPGGFIEILNDYLGTTELRLPTEAEWEYAARAGTTTRFSHGDVLQCDDQCGPCTFHDPYMWWCGNDNAYLFNPVAMKEANPWGLFDAHGNGAEWVQDWWSSSLGTEPQTDPTGAQTGSLRVLRDCNPGAYAVQCRSAYRSGAAPSNVSSAGFRLAKSE